MDLKDKQIEFLRITYHKWLRQEIRGQIVSGGAYSLNEVLNLVEELELNDTAEYKEIITDCLRSAHLHKEKECFKVLLDHGANILGNYLDFDPFFETMTQHTDERVILGFLDVTATRYPIFSMLFKMLQDRHIYTKVITAGHLWDGSEQEHVSYRCSPSKVLEFKNKLNVFLKEHLGHFNNINQVTPELITLFNMSLA